MSLYIAEPLFSGERLGEFLGRRGREMLEEIKQQQGDYVLNVSLDDYVSYLVDRYSVHAPTLAVDDVYVNTDEVDIDISKYPMYGAHRMRRGPVFKTGLSVTYHIPYVGDGKLFCLKPRVAWSIMIDATVTPSELFLRYEHPESDTTWMKERFERDLTYLLRHLESITNEAQSYNRSLEGRAKANVEARRGKLLRDQDMIAALGVPVKRRDGAPTTYAVPDVRRKPHIVKPVAMTAPFKPEPTLLDAEYQNILNIVSRMSTALERSPRTFVHMDEEQLRDFFLVYLNDQYEGRATGETFNADGKTDILIRDEGRTIFIGECKIWKGAQKFTEAIGQILGYTSWRDTKTAILLFNRNKNLTAVLEQIPSLVAAHPNFKRSLGSYGETGFQYRLHHRDDSNRELTLTVLAFDVPRNTS